jgi:competence protein ComGC
VIAVVLVVAALMVVVVGQAMLASGQVRLTGVEAQLKLEQSTHRQRELAVAQLETPVRIVGAALAAGLVHESQVTELPYVPLTTPVPAPHVTPAPTTATTATNTSTAATP